MSVFTIVTPEELAAWLRNYSIGTLNRLEGIAAGIENTNYFVTTTHGRYVLTLFEKLQAHELPFYMNLMTHLSAHGIPCPQPIANLSNQVLSEINGKPASIFTCMPGADVREVDAPRCATISAACSPRCTSPVGAMPRRCRTRAARSGGWPRPKSRRFSTQTPPRCWPPRYAFRRSIVTTSCRAERYMPIFFATTCCGTARASAASSISISRAPTRCSTTSRLPSMTGASRWDPRSMNPRAHALLAVYQRVRPFTSDEHAAWPQMLRAGALRFWVSRLYDFHLPRAGALVHAKDPAYFQRMLEQHIAHPVGLAKLLG